MKLSEIKGDKVFDVVAEIIDPIAEIAQDPTTKKIFKPIDSEDDANAVFVKRAAANVPALIKSQKKNIVKVLAALNEVTPEEYERELTLPKLISDVMSILTDAELLAFLSQPSGATQA